MGRRRGFCTPFPLATSRRDRSWSLRTRDIGSGSSVVDGRSILRRPFLDTGVAGGGVDLKHLGTQLFWRDTSRVERWAARDAGRSGQRRGCERERRQSLPAP